MLGSTDYCSTSYAQLVEVEAGPAPLLVQDDTRMAPGVEGDTVEVTCPTGYVHRGADVNSLNVECQGQATDWVFGSITEEQQKYLAINGLRCEFGKSMYMGGESGRG